jgi:regulator of RNase E activity RraA
MSASLTSGELEALGAFSTPTICNAIETFNARPRDEGFMDPSIICRTPGLGSVVGYAVTARMRAGTRPSRELSLSDLLAAFEPVPQPWMVVVEDLDTRPVGSIWGEVNATAFGALGALGAITNGGVRDLPEVRRTGFQLFSACVLVSHAYAHFVAAGDPVVVGGLRVAPGDLLHADEHGVVSIPIDTARDLPQAARKIEEQERQFIDYARAPGAAAAEIVRLYSEAD